MKITIRKPSKINLKTSQGLGTPKSYLRQFDFFYDYSAFASRNFPVGAKYLVVVILLASVLTFGMYFLSSYLRASDLENIEIAKQVAFINYTLWFAYLMFVVGLNGLVILAMRIKKFDLGLKSFFLNQTFVAVVMFVMMRFVATVLIFLDERLPFEINYNFRFFNFSLLTVLFLSQMLLVIVVYNYLKLNLGRKISKYPFWEMLIAVVYTASVWTLTAP